jgi:hypothetical protein
LVSKPNTIKLEHIGDASINNLTTKMVVYLSAIQIVGTTRKHQNDQVSTQELPTLGGGGGGEYSKRNEELGVDEDDVASLPNLQNMHQREAPPIGCSNWHKKECGLFNPKGIFFAKNHVTTSNLTKAILDDSLGDDHISLTILYYPRDISTIMTIWNWSLV